MYFDYIYILILGLFTLILSLGLMGFSLYVSSIQHLTLVFDKLMRFECGFLSFKDSRSTFNISFYLLGILFLIFDLEIIYLLRWTIIILESRINYYWIVLFFIIILTLGFIYEWSFGALSLAFIGN